MSDPVPYTQPGFGGVLPDRQSTLNQIALLRKLQLEALSSSTFIGMTQEQTQDYDARRCKIVNLVQNLLQLE